MAYRGSKERAPQIGEVYLMQFDGDGSEQCGLRPGLVFQNNTGNAHSPNIIALPLTSACKKVFMPTHVLVYAADTGLKKDSVVLCENPQRMSKDKVKQYITKLPDKYMSKIAEANLLASGAIAYIDMERLITIWKKAAELNAAIPA